MAGSANQERLSRSGQMAHAAHETTKRRGEEVGRTPPAPPVPGEGDGPLQRTTSEPGYLAGVGQTPMVARPSG
jgi:hypothetical protein